MWTTISGCAAPFSGRVPRVPAHLHDTIYPWRVAELLILREDMPRSLHHCYAIVLSTLDELAKEKPLECRRLAGQTHAQLCYGQIQAVFREGLHEYLTRFIEDNHALGSQIQEDFLMTPMVMAEAV